MIRPASSSLRNSSQLAQSPTRLELAINTRGAHSWVRKTPTGLPLWTSMVSSFSSERSVLTRASYDSQLRAAFPVPPYTTRSSGRSAFSGSRLFINIRSGASVCHDFAVRSVPWAAWIGSLGFVVVMAFSSSTCSPPVQRNREARRQYGAARCVSYLRPSGLRPCPFDGLSPVPAADSTRVPATANARGAPYLDGSRNDRSGTTLLVAEALSQRAEHTLSRGEDRAVTHQLDGPLDVGREEAVRSGALDPGRAQQRDHRFGRRRGLQRTAQVQGAGRGEDLDREHAGQTVDGPTELAGTGPAHRHVVLLHRTRRDGVDRRGYGEPLELGDDPGLGVLRDHVAGVDARIVGEEGR